MRTVASYALESHGLESTKTFDRVILNVNAWLLEKGWASESTSEFQSVNGSWMRIARLSEVPPEGRLERFAVIERMPDARFVTEIVVGGDKDCCAVAVELKIEGTTPRIEPFRFDARRPKLLGMLLSHDLDWQLGDTPLTDRSYFFRGQEEGGRLVDIIWHRERSVPVILVSYVNGAGITANFASKLAGDLAGLAIVAVVDEDAAWKVTRRKGSMWSCFNGAVRLYWPITSSSSEPRLHPLWFRSTILENGTDPANASYRMRAQLRRQIMGVSAFAVREPSLIRRLKQSVAKGRQEDLKAALKNGRSAEEFRKIAESYASDNDELRDQVAQDEEKISSLESQVSELQLALQFMPQGARELIPDTEDDFQSVREAVDAARLRFKGLIWGDRLDEGIDGLNLQAGPPEKIYRYLSILDELFSSLQKGSLGVGIVDWLQRKGVSCSVESETVRNSGERCWPVSGEMIDFDYHLKPSDGVSPDRCVRIYFDVIEGSGVRIGWLGRHPGT